MELPQDDLDDFKRGEHENKIFWSRFAEQPDLKGSTVLDVGSGWGRLCVDMALAGAEKVVGLDLKTNLVDFSNTIVRLQYPQLVDIVSFEAEDLRDYDDSAMFDLIVSKDSFEHIIHLDGMLWEMKKRLKPGDRIYAGFGPLYTSLYGDHDRRTVSFRSWGLLGRSLALIPWGHLFMERLILNMHNRNGGRKAESMYDLGLNKMSVSDYRRAFLNSGFNIVDMRVNRSGRFASELFYLVGRIPFLEDYLTHNIYCILENSGVPLRSPDRSDGPPTT